VRVRHLAVDDVEEGLLQRLGDRAAAAGADLLLVDRRTGVTSAAVPTKNTSSAM
jgi:hypothetical protein